MTDRRLSQPAPELLRISHRRPDRRSQVIARTAQTGLGDCDRL